jgi:hypothetical protein
VLAPLIGAGALDDVLEAAEGVLDQMTAFIALAVGRLPVPARSAWRGRCSPPPDKVAISEQFRCGGHAATITKVNISLNAR